MVVGLGDLIKGSLGFFLTVEELEGDLRTNSWAQSMHSFKKRASCRQLWSPVLAGLESPKSPGIALDFTFWR